MNVTKESLVNFLQFKNVCIQDWSEVRRVLGPYAVKVAAHVMNDEELAKLRDINDYCKASLALDKEEEVINGLVQFHRVIARCTENPILILILSFIEGLMEDTNNILRPQTEILQGVIDSHVAIYEATAKP